MQKRHQAASARRESRRIGGYFPPLSEASSEIPTLVRRVSVVVCRVPMADPSGDHIGVALSPPSSRNDKPQCGEGDRKETSP